jgi:hypothetical protein
MGWRSISRFRTSHRTATAPAKLSSGAERQHVVEPGEESLAGRVRDDPPAMRGKGGEGLVEGARGGGLDELTWALAAGGGSPRQQFAGLVGTAADEDRPPSSNSTAMPT